MQPKNRLIFSLLAILLIGYIVFACQHLPKNSKPFPVAIHEGDIVFRRGSSLASRLVLTADKAGIYSHIGIIAQLNDSFVVVHAVPGEENTGQIEKVKIESLSSFFAPDKAVAGAVMRSDLSSDSLHRVAQKALKLYYRNTPFDNDYNLNDSTKMYCSELVWYAFKTAGVDITNKKRSKIDLPVFQGEYIFPSDIQTNKKLKLIYSF